MALQNRTKSITLTANSVVNEVSIAQFTAMIDVNHPESMSPGRIILDNEAYRINRTTVMSDQNEFETEAYTIMEAQKGEIEQ